MTHRKAKDILRASRLPLLGKDNVHDAADLDKAAHGERLSPVLLVHGQIQPGLLPEPTALISRSHSTESIPGTRVGCSSWPFEGCPDQSTRPRRR